MNIKQLKNKLLKTYPLVEIDFGSKNELVLKNITSSKRFDMGFAWDCYMYIVDDKIIKKTYKFRTYDNVRADFSKEIKPSEEVEKKLEEILHFLNLKAK